jgi:DNA replication licensing factor MCM7
MINHHHPSLKDVDGDTALARHITYVHKHNRNPELGFTPFEPDFIKNYVAFARRYDPEVVNQTIHHPSISV